MFWRMKRPWLVRVPPVEVIHSFQLIQGLSRAPICLLVSCPFYQVFQASPTHPRVQDLIHIPILFSIHLYWRGRGCSLSRERVIVHGVQVRHVLNRVYLNFIWQLQLVGPGRDDLNDLVGSNAAMVQFAAWAASDDVLGVKPYSIPFLERWGRSPSLVRTLAIAVLGTEDLGLEVFLDLFQLSGRLVRIRFGRNWRGLFALP
jgi:hypothetical protein